MAKPQGLEASHMDSRSASWTEGQAERTNSQSHGLMASPVDCWPIFSRWAFKRPARALKHEHFEACDQSPRQCLLSLAFATQLSRHCLLGHNCSENWSQTAAKAACRVLACCHPACKKACLTIGWQRQPVVMFSPFRTSGQTKRTNDQP